MHFEPTITVGNLLSAAMIMTTVIAAAWHILVHIKKLQWRVGMIWAWYKREHNIKDEETDE